MNGWMAYMYVATVDQYLLQSFVHNIIHCVVSWINYNNYLNLEIENCPLDIIVRGIVFMANIE